MSIQSAILFDQDGKPTYTLISQARSKSPLKPLQAAIAAVDSQGAPTEDFRAWWNAGFPTRRTLPDLVANPDGTGTLEFWQVFT